MMIEVFYENGIPIALAVIAVIAIVVAIIDYFTP